MFKAPKLCFDKKSWGSLKSSIFIKNFYPLREKCPNKEFFLSLFSLIRTKYGEILRISPYSVRIRANTDQKKLRIWTLFKQWPLLGVIYGYLFDVGSCTGVAFIIIKIKVGAPSQFHICRRWICNWLSVKCDLWRLNCNMVNDCLF